MSDEDAARIEDHDSLQGGDGGDGGDDGEDATPRGEYVVTLTFPDRTGPYDDPPHDPAAMSGTAETLASAIEGILAVLREQDGIEGTFTLDYTKATQIDSGERDASWLIHSGLLWLINASVFHPRGMAMGVNPETNKISMFAAAPGEAMCYIPRTERTPNGVDLDMKYRQAEQTMAEVRMGQHGHVYDRFLMQNVVDQYAFDVIEDDGQIPDGLAHSITDLPARVAVVEPSNIVFHGGDTGATVGQASIMRDEERHARPSLWCSKNTPHRPHVWYIRAHGPEVVCSGYGRYGVDTGFAEAMVEIEERWDAGEWSTGRLPEPSKVQVMVEVGDLLDKISYVLGQDDIVSDRSGTVWVISLGGMMAASESRGPGGVQSIGIFTLEKNHGPFTVVALAAPRERR